MGVGGGSLSIEPLKGGFINFFKIENNKCCHLYVVSRNKNKKCCFVMLFYEVCLGNDENLDPVFGLGNPSTVV